MAHLHWIRLDIPYQQDGNKMRYVIGHAAEGGELATIVSASFENIPLALEDADKVITEKGLKADENTVLVYPHDGRMSLAWVVKEAGDERGWKFERQIPTEHLPDAEVPVSFELSETGSEEDKLAPGPAQRIIFDLNNDAREEYQSMDLPEAMSKLRYALQMAFKHFGWTSPGMAYCLTNFGHVMRGTGNGDNIREAISGVDRMLHHWLQEPPKAEEWNGSQTILEQLIGVCEAMGAIGQAAVLKGFAEGMS